MFVFVGDPADAPAELTGWRFAGHATRGRLTLPFRGEDVGRKATVVARGYNAKGETGPTGPSITGTIAA